MRGLFLALALAFGALSPVGLAGCATFQQLQPQSAREALAEAEIGLIGAITVTSDAHRAAAITNEDAQRLYQGFVQAAEAIDTARTLIRAGDEAGANRSLAIARAIIRAASIELSRRAELVRNGSVT